MPSTNYAQLFQYDSERAENLRVCLFELYKLKYPDTYASRMQAYGDIFEKHGKELLGFFGFSESDDHNTVAKFAKKISDEVEKPNRQKLTIEEVKNYALECRRSDKGCSTPKTAG